MHIHALVCVDMFSFLSSKYLGTDYLCIAFPFVSLLTLKAKFSECLYRFIEVYETFRCSTTSLTLGIFFFFFFNFILFNFTILYWFCHISK